MNYNIIVSGLGGDGVVLLSKIITSAALAQGLKVKSSENHGHAKRGGSVVTHIRIGDNFSPVIPFGNADLIISFEPEECLRYIHYLKEDGLVLVDCKDNNDSRIEDMSKYTKKILLINLLNIIKEVGNPKIRNAILLGAVASLPSFLIESERLKDFLLNMVPRGTEELNIKAFEWGYKAQKRQKL